MSARAAVLNAGIPIPSTTRKTSQQQQSPRNERQPQQQPLTEAMIAARAYEIYLREGSVDGRDQAHWFQAIKELTGP